MCFGSDKYEESTVISSGSRVRDSYSSKPNRGGLFSGCFGDDEVYVVRDPRYHSHRRYGSRQTYYPAQYYAQPPRVVYVGNPYHHGHDMPRGVYLGGVGMGYGGGRHGRASMPTNGARPGRRGVLVHNGQIPNGSAPSGIYAGGIGMGVGTGGMMGGGMNCGQAGYYPGVGARSYGMYGGGAGYYPGAYGAQMHTRPLYYGPNASSSAYSPRYYNYPSNYYNFPSYSYYSPYASHGLGCGSYANYYYPYQRSYYAAGVAAPAYSYAYQTMAPAVAVPVMPTTTYAVNAQVPMTTTTPVTTTYRAGANTRMNLQEENRILASRRGAYNPKFIKPADARPEDPFWCKERTGEWHLRSYYQIENECQPGAWLMDPELGNLTFHRH